MTDKETLELAEIMSLTKRMEEHMTLTESESYKKELILEMAYERKMFKALLTNFSRQIVENWCLVRYVKISGDKQELLVHWSNELISYISNAASNKIKGNNGIKSRIKAISEVWNDEKEYNQDVNIINLTICAKFLKEGIDTHSPVYFQVLNDCIKASDSIINIIAEANPNSITDYVSSI